MTPASPVLLEVSPHLAEIIMAKDQPPYMPMPVIRSGDTSGRVTSRWELTWSERLRILFTGNIWLQTLTFNRRLQPVKILTEQPEVADCL